MSVGATFYPATKEDSFTAMYKRADDAAYISKKERNNVVTFNCQQEDPHVYGELSYQERQEPLKAF